MQKRECDQGKDGEKDFNELAKQDPLLTLTKPFGDLSLSPSWSLYLCPSHFVSVSLAHSPPY